MLAREIMTTPVVSVRPDTPIRVAAALLCQHNISAVPVLDPDDRLVGIVSEVDLLQGQLPHDSRTQLRRLPADGPVPTTVGEVLTAAVVAFPPFTDAADIADIALNVRSVPIVDASRVVGILSRRDLLRTLIRDDATIRADVLHRLGDCYGADDRWTVEVQDGSVRLAGACDDVDRRIARGVSRSVAGVVRVDVAPVQIPAGR